MHDAPWCLHLSWRKHESLCMCRFTMGFGGTDVCFLLCFACFACFALLCFALLALLRVCCASRVSCASSAQGSFLERGTLCRADRLALYYCFVGCVFHSAIFAAHSFICDEVEEEEEEQKKEEQEPQDKMRRMRMIRQLSSIRQWIIQWRCMKSDH